MKLPSIPAPKFDGDLQNWTSFLDEFNARFHNNEVLSDVQRLQFLKSCLIGPAAEVVRTIPTTDANYRIAYDVLVERYENKSLIIQSHIRSLFQTPQVHKPTASELRQLHHHVVFQVNALKALGQPIEAWDAWLVTLLCCRLDSTTVGEWQLLQKTKDLPIFTNMEKFLANRVSAYEVGEVGNQSTQLKQSSTGIRPMQKRVLFTNQSNNVPLKEKQCIMCPEQHRLSVCESFSKMPLSDRQDLVYKNRLCYNCLYPGHQVCQCRGGNCNRCGKRHNTKLHSDTPYNPPASANEQSSSIQKQSVVTYVEQGSNNSAATKQIILATALVNLTNAIGQQVQCRAILDSGSQVCLITKECALRLNISVVKSSLSIAGIGSVTAKTGSMIMTTVSSRLNNFEAFMNFHIIDSITNSLPTHRINMEPIHIPYTVNSQLADPHFSEPASIDILLGAEIFFEVLVGESMKVSPLVILHNTNFGWIFTGSVQINNLLPQATSLVLRHCKQSAIALIAQSSSNSFSLEAKAFSLKMYSKKVAGHIKKKCVRLYLKI